MDDVQAELFGSFPRRVGTPDQHWVYNEAQFDLFTETVDGARNAYATVGRYPFDGRVISDKVLFDLDGDKSVFAEGSDADERVARMRDNPGLAASVLGTVCEEAQRLARASRDDGIPVIGVFSGFGIHVHQLYQPTEDPKAAMTTCAAKYIEELDLQTADWKVVGDVQRICRVPNVERVTHEATVTGSGHQRIEDGRPTGLYCVPLSGPELTEVNPQALLDISSRPRPVNTAQLGDRPQMPIWEEYRDETGGDAELPQRPVDTRTASFEGEEDMEAMLHDLVKMPCIAERLAQPNPEHEVRLNGAVILFNIGMSPQEVEHLFGQLGWVDYDSSVTLSYLEDIYQTKYSDMACKTLREKRLCTRSENPKACDCFGWSGGQPEW